MNKRKLTRNLDFIFSSTTRHEPAPGPIVQLNRYVAKSLNGGTGWGVYDRRQERFLKDPEVAALKFDELGESFTS